MYKIVKQKELRGLFLLYHTMDPVQVIKRILEAKGMPTNEKEELERQYEILKKYEEGNKGTCLAIIFY